MPSEVTSFANTTATSDDRAVATASSISVRSGGCQPRCRPEPMNAEPTEYSRAIDTGFPAVNAASPCAVTGGAAWTPTIALSNPSVSPLAISTPSTNSFAIPECCIEKR